MRALVIARLTSPLPLEHQHEIVDRFEEWREKYREQMEDFEFFISNGGCAIAKVADEVELKQIMLEYPLLDWSEIEVEPVVDGDIALAQWRKALEAQPVPA